MRLWIGLLENAYCAFRIASLAASTESVECFVNYKLERWRFFFFQETKTLEKMHDTCEKQQWKLLAAPQPLVATWLYRSYANKWVLYCCREFGRSKYLRMAVLDFVNLFLHIDSVVSIQHCVCRCSSPSLLRKVGEVGFVREGHWQEREKNGAFSYRKSSPWLCNALRCHTWLHY